MTIFIILCALMCLTAMAAVALPLWFSGSAKPDASRREQVLAILRQQAVDLEAEREAGKIDKDEYEESRLELERRVLEETQDEAVEQTGTRTRLARQLAIVIATIIPCAAVFGYLALGNMRAMDPSFLEQVNRAAGVRGHSASEMAQMLEGLKADLEQNPNNPQGWYMLAQTAASMNRFDEAAAAFKELNRLVPNNADLMADMADMMAAANGRVITPDVEKILEEALKINPEQWKALALLAIRSWDRQQYLRAAELWERLLKVVPSDFPNIESIRESINEAKRLGGVNDSISKVSPTASDRASAEGTSASEASKGPVRPVPTASPADMRFVSGKVTLEPGLAAKASPDDIVFVYARPEHSRMPVAFLKVKVKDLPYDFRLDETMTMAMGAETMANVDTVIVGARISKTGNFMPQSGDLEGEMDVPVAVGKKDLHVRITRIRQ